jgi:hypothetical protein
MKNNKKIIAGLILIFAPITSNAWFDDLNNAVNAINQIQDLTNNNFGGSKNSLGINSGLDKIAGGDLDIDGVLDKIGGIDFGGVLGRASQEHAKMADSVFDEIINTDDKVLRARFNEVNNLFTEDDASIINTTLNSLNEKTIKSAFQNKQHVLMDMIEKQKKNANNKEYLLEKLKFYEKSGLATPEGMTEENIKNGTFTFDAQIKEAEKAIKDGSVADIFAKGFVNEKNRLLKENGLPANNNISLGDITRVLTDTQNDFIDNKEFYAEEGRSLSKDFFSNPQTINSLGNALGSFFK